MHSHTRIYDPITLPCCQMSRGSEGGRGKESENRKEGVNKLFEYPFCHDGGTAGGLQKGRWEKRIGCIYEREREREVRRKENEK